MVSRTWKKSGENLENCSAFYEMPAVTLLFYNHLPKTSRRSAAQMHPGLKLEVQ